MNENETDHVIKLTACEWEQLQAELNREPVVIDKLKELIRKTDERNVFKDKDEED